MTGRVDDERVCLDRPQATKKRLVLDKQQNCPRGQQHNRMSIKVIHIIVSFHFTMFPQVDQKVDLPKD